MHNRALDGFRGVAALLVVLSHMGHGQINLLGLWDLTGAGKYGVYAFFVLSSFLLMLPFLKLQFSDLLHLNLWGKFFKKRFFRIYPLYFFALCAFAGLGYGGFIDFGYSDVISHLLLIEGKRHFWAIPVEVKFYLSMPVIVIFFIFLAKSKIYYSVISFLLLVFIVGFVLPYSRGQQEYVVNTINLLHYIEVFLLGGFMAVFHHHFEKNGITRKLSLVLEALGYVCIAVIIFMIPSVWNLVTGSAVDYDYFHAKSLIFGLLWGGILLATTNGVGAISKFLGSRLVAFYGMVSFSIYLWHPIILGFTKRIPVGDFLQNLVFIGIVTVVGYYSYKYIEAPFIQKGKNLSSYLVRIKKRVSL